MDITQREVVPAYEGLLSYDFDLILGEEYPGLVEKAPEGVDRADLLADPLCLVLPATGPYATRPHRLADLTDTPWALNPADAPTGQWVRTICRRARFEPRVQFDSPDPLLHAHLVRSGLAAAVVPALLAAEHLAGTRLVSLPGDPHRMLYTAVRAGRATHPAVRAFREALSDALAAQRPATPAWAVVLDG